MSEWINLKRKKPKKGEIVDIYATVSGRLIGYRYAGGGDFEVVRSGRSGMGGNSSIDPVTHWMPTPEPPRNVK